MDMKTSLGRPYNFDNTPPHRILYKDDTTFKIYFQNKISNLVDVVQHKPDHVQRLQLHQSNYDKLEETLIKAGFICV